MLRRRRSLYAWTALALMTAGCDGSSPGAPRDRFEVLSATIEGERRALGVPGVAVAVVEHGQVTYARGFGRSDPRGDRPVGPATLFRIGSVTKMLTAIAVLQQVQLGRVTLDAPVVEYIPGFHFSRDPSAWVPAITVRELLDHTSGIGEYFEVSAPPGEQDDGALARFLTGRFTEHGCVQYAPGAIWSYSNPNYMLAGRVAEASSGLSYRDLVRTSVLGPLGMTRTVFLPEEVLADGDYAVGLACTAQESGCASPFADPVMTPTTYDNAWARPAGYAWSSVLDLARLAAFLVRGEDRVLSSEQRRGMLTSQVTTHQLGDLTGYGYGVAVDQGFFLGPFYRATVIAHDGAIAGYRALIFCVPDADFCFITLANGDAGSFPRSLETALATLATLPPPSAPPALVPDAARFAAYAGDYIDPYVVGSVRVTDVDGTLHIAIPSLDEEGVPYTHELTPTVIDGFAMEVAGTTWPLTFLADDRGVYRYLRAEGVVATRAP